MGTEKMWFVYAYAITNNAINVLQLFLAASVLGIAGNAMAHAGVSNSEVHPVDAEDAVGLGLSDQLAESVERHVQHSAALDGPLGIATICSLAKSAQELAPLLATALGARHSALLSTVSGSGGIAELDAFNTRIERADKLLVGIGLQVGAEAVYSYVRYDELADISSAHPDEAALFRALAGLWRNPTGWPIYIEQQTDIAGCTDPGALVAPLAMLERAWARAPQCARQVVMDAVRRSVRDVSAGTACYCRTRDETLADVDRVVGVADAIGFGMPEPDLVVLRDHLHRDEVRFECLPN